MTAISAELLRRFYVYAAPPIAAAFANDCAAECAAAGFEQTDDPSFCAFAIAPCLRRKLTAAEFSAPVYGTLIFHPSILPRHRGPDAIRWTYRNREPVAGVTWFWATDDYDAGPICEQEPLVVDFDQRPRDAYLYRFQPAGLRALTRALAGIAADNPRRVPQEHALATLAPQRPG